MDTNETNQDSKADDVIVLGVASVETQGGVFKPGEAMGLEIGTGISEE